MTGDNEKDHQPPICQRCGCDLKADENDLCGDCFAELAGPF